MALNPRSGIVGVDITYETQRGNAPLVFPPAIQGRGDDVYAIAVVCPNAYQYVDLDTYACRNHFFYLIDGLSFTTGFKIGNGSTGSIVNCHYTSAYWQYLGDSISPYNSAINDYTQDHMKMYVLGNCDELVMKTFCIFPNTLIDFIAESGVGPIATCVHTNCDIAHQGYLFEAAGPSDINLVNTLWMVANYPTSTDPHGEGAVTSTAAFTGSAKLFSLALHDLGSNYDYNIAGGDVSVALANQDMFANGGTNVTGGAFHLVNACSYARSSGSSIYNYPVALGSAAGLSGAPSEIISVYSPAGAVYANGNASNPIEVWSDFSNSSAPVLSLPTAPYATTYETESLAVLNSSEDTHRIISAPQFSGGYGTILDANATGDFVTYTVPSVAAGTYNVAVGIKKTNTRGIWQLAAAKDVASPFTNIGGAVDEYSAGEAYAEVNLGTWTPGSSTDKAFRFTVTGKNGASTGYTIAFDYLKLSRQ